MPSATRPQHARRLRNGSTLPGPHALAVAISALMASPLLHADAATTPAAAAAATGDSAQTAAPAAAATAAAGVTLDTLQVEERTLDSNPYAQAGAPYKARVSGDARHVRPLAETPQTIEVLTQSAIQDAGNSDLREILDTLPGITLGTGENGNAFGDRYVIRGHEARSDVFVDSLRDPGMTLRESFATEQVEVSKGPSSTFAGRGTTGGAVNSVSKQASSEYDFTKLQIGAGTDAYRRITLDANNRASDTLAVRINTLQAYEEVPDRDRADRARNGFALSAAWTPADAFTLIGDYYHLDASDTPDLGTWIRPLTAAAGAGRPVHDVFSYIQDEDFLTSQVDVATLRARYAFSDRVRVENALRFGSTDNGYLATGARGGTRDATDPAGAVATVTLSTHQGWQDVAYVVDQLNLFLDADIAGMTHQWVFGAEFSDQDVLNGVYVSNNTGATNCILPGRGGNPPAPGHCATDAGGAPVGNIATLLGRDVRKGTWDSDYGIRTTSLSVMDTVDLGESVSVFAGVRLDSFDYSNRIQNTGTLVVTPYAYADDLFNYHLGTVVDVTDQGNVYLTFSSASEINGGESDLGASCGYGGLCGANPAEVAASEPEQVRNVELGSKWNLLDEKLLASAALFQVTKDDVMESVGSSYATTGTLNTGRNRVEGIEVSLAGNLGERLGVQFGAATLTSEVLASFTPANVGKKLSNVAEDSLFLQLRYAATPKLAVGGTVTYSGEMHAGQPDSAAAFDTTTGKYSYTVPGYTLLDLFASYAFAETLQLRLNVNNAADANYYLAAYRSGAFTYIGDARNANLTLSWDF